MPPRSDRRVRGSRACAPGGFRPPRSPRRSAQCRTRCRWRATRRGGRAGGAASARTSRCTCTPTRSGPTSASVATRSPRAVITASVVRASDGWGTRRTSLSPSSLSMMFVTVAGGMRKVLLIQLRAREDSGSMANQARTSIAGERQIMMPHDAVHLVVEQLVGAQDGGVDGHPDAASGSHRSSQTRREASTTSKGAFWKLIASDYGPRVSVSGGPGQRAADNAVGFESSPARPESGPVRSGSRRCAHRAAGHAGGGPARVPVRSASATCCSERIR